MKQRMGRVWLAATVMAIAAATAGAQVVPIAIGSTIGGLAPGSGNAQCTTGYATAPVGSGPFSYGDGCPATQATLSSPYAANVDSMGNVFVADYNHFELRVIYNGGSALAAAIVAANPWVSGLTPTKGNMYLLAGGSRQATISKTGTPSAYYCNSAGSLSIAINSGGSGCPGGYAYIKPRQMAVDRDGNVFWPNISGGAGIKMFYVGGALGAALIKVENPGVTAQPGFVYDVAIGTGTGSWTGDGSLANSTAVHYGALRGVAVDANENMFIADGTTGGAADNDVRVVAGPNTTTLPIIGAVTPGYIYTLAGGYGCVSGSTCPFGYAGDNGLATKALFNTPYSILTDANGNVYVGDYSNGRVRAIYMGSGTLPGITNPTTGYIYTVVGGGASVDTPANNNKPATSLVFTVLKDFAIDAAGNLYAFDTTSQYLWRVDAKTGIATVQAGIGTGTAPTAGNYCTGTSGTKSVDSEGDGCPATQSLDQMTGAGYFDAQGNMYQVDSSTGGLLENVVRKYSFGTQFPATAVGSSVTQAVALQAVAATTLTGESFLLENGATAEFADAGSNTCAATAALALNQVCVFNVKFTPAQAGARTGTQSFAYSGGPTTNYLGGDGVAAEAALDPGTQTTIGTGLKPNGVGTDLNGNLYVSDLNSNSVLKVAASGGTPATLITGLSLPSQVAVDGKGNVYVADSWNNRIAMTGPTGGTITALGTGLKAPQGVAVDAAGNVYAADTGNARVVRINGSDQVTLPIYTSTYSLTTPVALALDSTGNLYVADSGGTGSVAVWTLTGTTAGVSTLNFGTSTFLPTGIAVDAAGDVYVSDATNKQVAEYPMIAGSLSTNFNQEIGSLTTPVGVAVDVNGSVYAADSGAAGVIALNRTLGSVVFPVTNLSTTSTESLSFTNVGNAALQFNGTAFGTISNAKGVNLTSFTLTAPTSSGCALATGIGTGTYCLLNANYLPTATSYPGFDTATFTPTTNSANGSGLSAALSGQAVLLINSTTTEAVTAPTGTTVYYGQAVTVQASTTFASNGGAATGTYTFTIDGHKQTPIAFSSTMTPTGTLSVPKNYLTVGSHTISVSMSVATPLYVYASSGTSIILTIAQATTTTTITPTPAATSSASSTLFTVNVTSAYATGETGTANIFSGTTQLNSSPLTVVNGVATYSTSQVIFPSNTFTAVYSGDVNFSGSTSAATTPSGDYNIVFAGSNLLYVQQGSNTITQFQMQPYFGYSGTVTPTCVGLPSYTICGFTPTYQQVAGTGSIIYNMSIYTSTTQTAQLHSAGKMSWALLTPFGLLGLALLRRRTKRGGMALLALVLAVSLAGTLAMSGCTNPIVPPTSGVTTPASTQTVTVNFTDNGTPQITHSLTFTLDVCNNSVTTACQTF